jgi:hypothetical protein
MKTIIKAKKDLYNKGLCFTKGNLYEVNGHIQVTASLMDKMITNNMGESHIIGSFWREFTIVEHI